ncbi:MAG: hypothetical protein AAF754_00920 [Pseudomonadota bacterium]
MVVGLPGRLGACCVFRIAMTGFLLVLACFPSVPRAAQPALQTNAAMIIGDDRGGLLTDRLHQMRRLLIRSQPVEIRGDVCFSTCTMLLGLPNVCVSPKTAFGFHGPSRSGQALDGDTFETASQIIAGFYPVPLRAWYLSTARHQIQGVALRSGQELIAMGVKTCAPRHASLIQ